MLSRHARLRPTLTEFAWGTHVYVEGRTLIQLWGHLSAAITPRVSSGTNNLRPLPVTWLRLPAGTEGQQCIRVQSSEAREGGSSSLYRIGAAMTDDVSADVCCKYLSEKREEGEEPSMWSVEPKDSGAPLISSSGTQNYLLS